MRDSPPVALPIPVKIGITLLSLQSPDESSLHYEVEFLLTRPGTTRAWPILRRRR